MHSRFSNHSLVFVALASVFALAAADWPQFRGPNATGVSSEVNIPIRFQEGDGILWKIALPGAGNSSPIVSKGKIFIQSASADGRQRLLLCLDAATGHSLWTRTMPGAKVRTHNLNTLASSTPAADGERVFALFWDGANVSLNAFDYDGQPRWQTDLGPFRSEHGAAASPVVFDHRVYVNYDQDRVNYKTGEELPGAEHATALLAFDAASGAALACRARRLSSLLLLPDPARDGGRRQGNHCREHHGGERLQPGDRGGELELGLAVAGERRKAANNSHARHLARCRLCPRRQRRRQ